MRIRKTRSPSRGLLELQRHWLSAFSPLIVVARSAASVSQVHLEGFQLSSQFFVWFFHWDSNSSW